MKRRTKRCACGKARCSNERIESFSAEGLWAQRRDLWPTPTASPNANRTKRSRPSEKDGRGHGRTLAGEVFSWPTPTVGGTGYKTGNKNDTWRPTLKTAAVLDARGVHPSKWPTPTCADGTRGSKTFARGNPTLVGAVKTKWPTPTASLGRHGKSGRGKNAQGGPSLGETVLWPTPTTNRATYGRRRGVKSATLRGLGQLNPHWVETLLGFPSGWVG